MDNNNTAKGHTLSLASPKNSLTSASVACTCICILMKMVHGFRCGFPVFGVRIPPLPVSVSGDLGPALSKARGAGDADDAVSGKTGVEVLLGVALSFSLSAFSRSTRSFSLRSFFSFFLAFSRSAFSDAVAPLSFGTGLSLPVVCGEVGSLALGLVERWGGAARSGGGAGVEPFVGGWLVLGRADVVELGVAVVGAVRLYA